MTGTLFDAFSSQNKLSEIALIDVAVRRPNIFEIQSMSVRFVVDSFQMQQKFSIQDLEGDHRAVFR